MIFLIKQNGAYYTLHLFPPSMGQIAIFAGPKSAVFTIPIFDVLEGSTLAEKATI